MMHGSVSNFRATLPVTFRLPHQQDLTIDFVVDTGFTDDLTLPSAAVAALGLPFLYSVSASLADHIHYWEHRCLPTKNWWCNLQKAVW